MIPPAIIALWKKDILNSVEDVSYPYFDMDYEIITHPERGLRGDPALFLALRYAKVYNADEFAEWYYDKSSAEIVSMFANIPFNDAYKLLNPLNIEYASITPQRFVDVLDRYLQYGEIVWDQ